MLIANISHLRSFLERHSFRVFMILGWRRWRNIDLLFLGLLSSDLFLVFVFFLLWIIVLHGNLWLFFFFFFRFRTVLFRCFVVLILKVIFYVIIVFLVIAKMKF